MNTIKIYFAPLEGVTGYIYRKAYFDFFGDTDKYFTPFITATSNGILGPKDLKDVLPENNAGLNLVPQLMTNKSEDFLKMSHALSEYGYDEVNLNLGCPSGTVVAKGRGSGFLSEPDKLDKFLDEIYGKSKIRISIKTRIGRYAPEEFESILKIYNQYPVSELIIHPRIQKDLYGNTPNMKVYSETVKNSKIPLCYNGDIFSLDDYNKLIYDFPGTDRVMLGRGLISNPGLAGIIKGKPYITKEEMKRFHDRLYNDYSTVMFGDRNILFKMKELWMYMIKLFDDSDKYAKKIRKSQKLYDYEKIVKELFEEKELIKN